MAKVRIMLKKKDSKQIECPVCVSVSDRGDRAYFVTGFTGTPQNFDEKGGRYDEGRGVKAFNVERIENGIKVMYTNKAANAILAELEKRARDLIKGYEESSVNWSVDILRNDYLNKPTKALFGEYARKTINYLKNEKQQYQTARLLEQTLVSLAQTDSSFEKKRFQDINTKYITRYIDTLKNRGIQGNTIAIRLSEIRFVVNRAIADGICDKKNYPFGNEDNKICVRAQKQYQTRKDNFLPMNYLAKLAQAELPTMRMKTAQHLFLLSYFCEGANWRDMAFWTDKSISEMETIDPVTGDVKSVRVIRYNRSKTKCLVETRISDEIQRELDWFKANTRPIGNYLLPIIPRIENLESTIKNVGYARGHYGIQLKKITALLEFPERFRDIAAYTARHTFAVALQVQGASAKTLQERLHHSEGDTEMQKNYTAKTLEITNVFDPTR